MTQSRGGEARARPPSTPAAFLQLKTCCICLSKPVNKSSVPHAALMRGSRTSIYGFQCHHQQASAAVDAAADADAKHHTFQTCNLLPHTTLFNSMDPVQALKNLQGMGFCLAACERALRVSDNSLDRCAWHGLIWSGNIQGVKVMVCAVICARRALDWLLANPMAASGEASGESAVRAQASPQNPCQ